MKREVVTEKEIKKDIRAFFMYGGDSDGGWTAVYWVVFALFTGGFILLFSTVVKGAEKAFFLSFMGVLLAVPVFMIVHGQIKIHNIIRAAMCSYTVKIDKLKSAETIVNVGKTSGKNSPSFAVSRGRFLFFESGVWMMQDKCYKWSKENSFDADNLKKNFHAGDEFYVVTILEKAVLVAYPLRVFEIGEDLIDRKSGKNESTEKKMNKDVVSVKSVKKDIRRSMAAKQKGLLVSLTVGGLLLAVLLSVILLLYFDLDHPGWKRAVLIFTIITAAGLAAVCARFAAFLIGLQRRISNFKVIKQPVRSSSGLDKLYGENGDDRGGVPVYRNTVYFEAGKWLIPEFCFNWSRYHRVLGLTFLQMAPEGTECYVIYGGDREVYAAYPVDWFELSREVEDIEFIREESKERRRRY